MTFSQAIVFHFLLQLRQNDVEVVKSSQGVAHLLLRRWKIDIVALLKMPICEESLRSVGRIERKAMNSSIESYQSHIHRYFVVLETLQELLDNADRVEQVFLRLLPVKGQI